MRREEYFKTRKHFLLYTLLHTEGRQRNNALGLRDQHYADPAAATQWADGILRELRSGPSIGTENQAVAKLNDIYDIVTLDSI